MQFCKKVFEDQKCGSHKNNNNHIGARHCPSLSVEASEFTKTRAFPTKSGENISSSVGEKVSDLGAGLANSW